MLSRGIVFVILSKNEEHHYLVLKMKNTMKMLLKFPRFWVYLQKRKEHHFLGLKIKKSNKKMPKTLGFWVYLQKKEGPLFSGNNKIKTHVFNNFSTPPSIPSDHHKKVTLAYKFCESRFATFLAYYGIFRPMSFMDLLDSQKIVGKVNVKVVEKRYVNKKMKLPIFVKNYLLYNF